MPPGNTGESSHSFVSEWLEAEGHPGAGLSGDEAVGPVKRNLLGRLRPRSPQTRCTEAEKAKFRFQGRKKAGRKNWGSTQCMH